MTPDMARDIIDKYLYEVKPEGYVEIAFFGGSFTGIPERERKKLLIAAKEYIDKGAVDGIRLSTRPDYISHDILEELQRYGVTAIELGVQSMDDEVLKLSGRGHTSDDVIKAAELIKEYPFELGLQMMTGLPGDTPEKSLMTAKKIAALKPDTTRVYPTLVIKGTALCTMMEKGDYTPWEVEETVELLAQIKEVFDIAGVRIIRMGLQTTEEISPDAAVVGGPFHEAIGELAENVIFYKKLCAVLKGFRGKVAHIGCNKGDVSKITGHKRCNAQKIYDNFKIKIKLYPDIDINSGELRLLR